MTKFDAQASRAVRRQADDQILISRLRSQIASLQGHVRSNDTAHSLARHRGRLAAQVAHVTQVLHGQTKSGGGGKESRAEAEKLVMAAVIDRMTTEAAHMRGMLGRYGDALGKAEVELGEKMEGERRREADLEEVNRMLQERIALAEEEKALLVASMDDLREDIALLKQRLAEKEELEDHVARLEHENSLLVEELDHNSSLDHSSLDDGEVDMEDVVEGGAGGDVDDDDDMYDQQDQEDVSVEQEDQENQEDESDESDEPEMESLRKELEETKEELTKKEEEAAKNAQALFIHKQRGVQLEKALGKAKAKLEALQKEKKEAGDHNAEREAWEAREAEFVDRESAAQDLIATLQAQVSELVAENEDLIKKNLALEEALIVAQEAPASFSHDLDSDALSDDDSLDLDAIQQQVAAVLST